MYLIDNFKKYIKETYINNKVTARRLVLSAPLWVLIIGIALASFGAFRYCKLVSNRKDQNMSSYWSFESEVNYRHMTVFAKGSRASGETSVPVYIDADNSLKRSDIIMIRSSLQDAADTGIAANGKGGLSEDGSPRGWEDCFSSFLTGNVTLLDDAGNSISSVDAQIVGVEGNFTAFHPFMFESGGFIPQTVIDPNSIVLNNNLAWRFFRSYDVVGRTVSLWNQEFTVIGVVSEPSDSLAKKTGSEEPRAYVHFSSLESYATDESSHQEIAILCYEAMLPELVRGVARTDIINALPTYSSISPSMYIVSNTGRFGIDDVCKYMWPIGETSTFISDYELPFWEEAADLTIAHLFADVLVVAAGIVLMFIGVIMLSLKSRKMSSKRNIRSASNSYNT